MLDCGDGRKKFGSYTVSFGGWRYWGDRVGGVGGLLSLRPDNWTIARWWLVVTIVENFLGAEPFRSVSEDTGGTGLGAWADLSRVAQSMGRSRIGEKDSLVFSTGRRFCIEEFVSIGGVGW